MLLVFSNSLTLSTLYCTGVLKFLKKPINRQKIPLKTQKNKTPKPKPNNWKKQTKQKKQPTNQTKKTPKTPSSQNNFKVYTLTWFHAYGFSYQVGSIMSRGFDLQIKLKWHKYSLEKYTCIWLITKTKDFLIRDTSRYLQGVWAKGNLNFPLNLVWFFTSLYFAHPVE